MMKPSVLLALLFSFLSLSSAEDPVVLGDNTNYFKGVWTGYLAPFNKGNATYTESLTLYPSQFPNNSTFEWNWPSQPDDKIQITGYLAIDYGDYYSTRPPVTVPPQTVANIVALTVSHNVTMKLPPNGNTVIYDLFLTAAPQGDDNHLFEIEVFVHSPPFAQNYVASLTQVGDVTISGISWSVAYSPSNSDILFMPKDKADIPVATIDLKAMFDYLKSKSLIKGSEWYNGHAFGVETANGAGSLVVNTLGVSYQPMLELPGTHINPEVQ